MKTNLLLAFLMGAAMVWASSAEAVNPVDIAQIPLASCLTDTEYRSASALAVDPVGRIVYQTKFRASDWSGQLLAYKVNSVGGLDNNSDGAVDDNDKIWEAGSVLQLTAYASRRPYTFEYPAAPYCAEDSTACPTSLQGKVFKVNNLSSLQIDRIGRDGIGILLPYFAGSRENEKPNGVLRQRMVLLGDLINSDPLFVGSEDYGYSSLPGDEGSRYKSFQAQKVKVVDSVAPRPRMVYVGGNDGMLHGFEAGTWNRDIANAFDTGHGTEVFSFFPGSILFDNIKPRAYDPFTDQQHKYLVDGSPKAGDAYFSDAWHTILVGGTGASPIMSDGYGGRSIFALDVTNPSDFSNTTSGVTKILWEFTDNATIAGLGWADEDLGLALAQPSLARMQNGKWGVIVSNGYNSKNQEPVLYVLDVSLKPNEAGFIMAKIAPCSANPKPNACLDSANGLSTPIAVDVNFDRKVDYIYAGDLQGNLWKFDVNCPNRSTTTGDDAACQGSAASTDWKVANNGSPLFIACANSTSSSTCGEGNRQPITGKPQVGTVSPDQANALYSASRTKPSVMVYFGTGKYLGLSDRSVSSSQQQTFYALWDNNSGNAITDIISGRDNLLQQTILDATITRPITQSDGTQTSQTLTNVRVTSNNIPCYTCTTRHQGWYMDLTTPSGKPSERIVSFPLLLNGNVLFTAFIPAADPCATPSQASSWVMEVDAITGSRPAVSPFDLFGGVAENSGPDSKFNNFDMVVANSTTMAPSGVKSTVGIVKTPAIIAGKGLMNKYLGGTTGDSQMVSDPGEPLGRVSWRQLR